ncbi:MAG: DUF2273 domain-containing protein [Selenomonadaceae bacterium]|nr:DUF2273 domain-containing protein [Selenomonadaceae bacterium]
MKETMVQFCKDCLREHPHRTAGTALGLLLGLAILLFGFWPVLFVALCCGIGWAVGNRMDRGETHIAETIDELLYRWQNRR